MVVQTWAIDNGFQARELIEQLAPASAPDAATAATTLQTAKFVRDALTGSSFRQHLFQKEGLVQHIVGLHEQLGADASPELLGCYVSILTTLFPSLQPEVQDQAAQPLLEMAFRLHNISDGSHALACIVLKCFTTLLRDSDTDIPPEAWQVERLMPFLETHLMTGPGSRTVIAACAVVVELAKKPWARENPMLLSPLLRALTTALAAPHMDPVHLLDAARALLTIDSAANIFAQTMVLPSLVSSVQQFVHSTHPHVRMAAIACLLAYPDAVEEAFIKQEILPRLCSLVRKEVAVATRTAAASFLGDLLNKEEHQALAADMKYLAAVADVLKPADEADLPPQLIKGSLMILAATCGLSEAACSKALDKGYATSLTTFLTSTNAAVRLAAATATKCITRCVRAVKSELMNTSLLPTVCKLLSDPDCPTRRQAVAAFSNLCVSSAISPLQTVEAATWTTLKHLLHEDDEDTRYAAFLAAQNLFKTVESSKMDVACRVLQELDINHLLHSYHHDPSVNVRTAAAGIFRNLACHIRLVKEVSDVVEGHANLVKEFVNPLFESVDPAIVTEAVYTLCNLTRTDGAYAAVLCTKYPEAIGELIQRLHRADYENAHLLQLAAARALANLVNHHKQRGTLAGFVGQFDLQTALDAYSFGEPEVHRQVELLKARLAEP
ncbi:hypothetical protein PTSG_00351 [Salpingoeca rosetta]|uniref:Uncharacterized protein n=1 Tax=Salpingoeca rosetta (strain ATCC 50818 / BSB-021) TaxID=946362 RepID=F2TW86_SALR5|nr:uncharacterized protein PTSG_00351 [Salpingoeca rosetta]EGD72332.1 hypothetical protein PTSG_00351 [Salpingoeca rosetta]|eukprot:XP_004998902.1 hypothetical protein PTSG_00351 [Salpingoeca rosetta]